MLKQSRHIRYKIRPLCKLAHARDRRTEAHGPTETIAQTKVENPPTSGGHTPTQGKVQGHRPLTVNPAPKLEGPRPPQRRQGLKHPLPHAATALRATCRTQLRPA